MFDNDYDKISLSLVHDFTEVNPAVAVLSFHTSAPFYLINVTENEIAKDIIKDHLGHVILEGEQFLRESYLIKTCNKHFSKLKFDTL